MRTNLRLMGLIVAERRCSWHFYHLLRLWWRTPFKRKKKHVSWVTLRRRGMTVSGSVESLFFPSPFLLFGKDFLHKARCADSAFHKPTSICNSKRNSIHAANARFIKRYDNASLPLMRRPLFHSTIKRSSVLINIRYSAVLVSD